MSKTVKIIIIVESILILLLGGYLVYDKVVLKLIKKDNASGNIKKDITSINYLGAYEIRVFEYDEFNTEEDSILKGGWFHNHELLLKEDKTFWMADSIETVSGISGTYKVDKDKIVLTANKAYGSDACVRRTALVYNLYIINDNKIGMDRADNYDVVFEKTTEDKLYNIDTFINSSEPLGNCDLP